MRPLNKIWVAALLLSCAAFAACADKKAAENLYIKALENYEKKDLKSASAFIDQSLRHDKKNEQAKFLKAKILIFQGLLDEAQEKLFDLKKSNLENKDIQIVLIQSLLLNEQKQTAKKEIENALKNDRGDWRLYQLAAIAAAKENDVQARLKALLEAQKALEGSAQIYYDLSMLWKDLGVDGKAKELKEMCLCLDKDYSSLFFEEEQK